MQGNVAMFEKLSGVVEIIEELESLKTSTIDHLQSLEFKRYFSELKEEQNALVRNSFSTSLVIANILNELAYRTNFVTFGMIISTWYFSWNVAFSVLVSCGWIIPTTVWTGFLNTTFTATTNLCESVFSALVHIKTKARNWRAVEKVIGLALSNTQLRISKLAIRLKRQAPHWKCLKNSIAV